MRMHYDSTPRLKEYLRGCPPGSTVHVVVVETRVEVGDAPDLPPYTLVVVYDLAPADAPAWPSERS